MSDQGLESGLIDVPTGLAAFKEAAPIVEVINHYRLSWEISLGRMNDELGIGTKIRQPIARSRSAGDDEPVLEIEPPDFDAPPRAAATAKGRKVDGPLSSEICGFHHGVVLSSA